MLLLLYLFIFRVLFDCGRILFSTHCFSPLLILLGDILYIHLCHFISAFFMRQIHLGMKEKRQTWIHRRWLQKPSGAKALNWLGYPAGCYYTVSSFLNFLQMKYMRIALFRVTYSYSLKDSFTPVALNQSNNSHQLHKRINREYP